MKMRTTQIAVCVLSSLLFVTSIAGADQTKGHSSYGHGDDVNLPNGIIGVSLHVGAERIGDPAVLYVAMVHPEGPAHQAGLAHGDEILTVDGITVTGKSYEEIVRMIRGDAGTAVKLGVKGEGAAKEVVITRIASDKLPKGPMGSHGQAK
ncbi:PDZ domain-containing protein [Petrachloros mirabilis]